MSDVQRQLHAAVLADEAAAQRLQERPPAASSVDPMLGDPVGAGLGGSAMTAEVDATGLLAAYRAGDVSPVAVVTGALKRAGRAHERLNCTVTVLAEQALVAAEEVGTALVGGHGTAAGWRSVRHQGRALGETAPVWSP